MKRLCRWAAPVAALLLAGPSFASDLAAATDGDSAWPRWQGRLSLGSSAPLPRPGGAARIETYRPPALSLMGDYYLTRSGWGFTESGGFRATSGLVLGHGARTLLSLSAAPSRQGLSVQQHHRLGGRPAAWPGTDRDAATSAYLGIGYTGITRGGWGFTADLGLLSHRPSLGRLGRAAGGTQSLDDALRALRLSPLVQMGVSYAF